MHSAMVLLTSIALVFDICLVVFVVTRLDRSRTVGLALLCMALLIYTLGYFVELLAFTPEAALTALKIENFGIPLIAPFYLITTINLFSHAKFKLWYVGAIFGYGLVIFGMVITNEAHMMYYTSIDMVPAGQFYVAQLERGPLSMLPQIVSVLSMLVSYVIMAMRGMNGPRKLRQQMMYFVAGSFIGVSVNLVQISSLSEAGLDITPFALAVGLMVFSISLVRDGLLDVVGYALNTAVETMEDAFIVVDHDGDFLYCNQRAKTLFPQLGMFQGTESIYSVDNWPEAEGLRLLQEEGQASFEQRDEEGNTRYYEAILRKIRSSGGMVSGWSVAVRDMTDAIQMIRQLEEQAATDPLTGALNRRQLFSVAKRELEAASRQNRTTAMMLFDLDHFKRINDTHGHNAGDKVLQETARVIQLELRVYDILGRVGGEEFVIFTQSSGEEQLIRFANRLREKLESLTVVYEGENIRYTASFGIVEIPPGGNFDTALHAADMAMYQAKEEGRNCVVMGSYG